MKLLVLAADGIGPEITGATVKAVVARSCPEVAPDELRDRVRLRLLQVQVEIREG